MYDLNLLDLINLEQLVLKAICDNLRKDKERHNELNCLLNKINCLKIEFDLK